MGSEPPNPAEAEVRSLVDRQAVVDVLVRYCTALDSRDWTLLKECFTDDAVGEYPRTTARSREEIEATVRRVLEPLDSSQHLIANHVVELHGDRAHAVTYLHAMHYKPGTEGGDGFTVGGRYDDDLVRTGDGWRITHRRVHVDWVEGNAAVVGWDPARTWP